MMEHVLAAWADLIPLAVLAGVMGLDVVSFPQMMISRPIVAATVGGTFVGAPFAGLLCGAALECLALEGLPVGASRYPEWGSASVAAGAITGFGTSGVALPEPGALTIGVAIGIAMAWLGGWSMVWHRQYVGRWARTRLQQLADGNRRTVVGLQLFGMTVDLARGAVLGALAIVPGRLLITGASSDWPLRPDVSRAIVVTCIAAVAAAAVWKDFHAITGTRRLFLLSLSVGTLWVMMRGS